MKRCSSCSHAVYPKSTMAFSANPVNVQMKTQAKFHKGLIHGNEVAVYLQHHKTIWPGPCCFIAKASWLTIPECRNTRHAFSKKDAWPQVDSSSNKCSWYYRNNIKILEAKLRLTTLQSTHLLASRTCFAYCYSTPLQKGSNFLPQGISPYNNLGLPICASQCSR